MKKLSFSIIGAALLAVVAFTSFTPKTVAQNHQKLPVAVAVLGLGTDRTGIYAYYVSTTPNCPDIQPGMPLAEAIAALEEAGFTLRTQVGTLYTYVRN